MQRVSRTAALGNLSRHLPLGEVRGKMRLVRSDLNRGEFALGMVMALLCGLAVGVLAYASEHGSSALKGLAGGLFLIGIGAGVAGLVLQKRRQGTSKGGSSP